MSRSVREADRLISETRWGASRRRVPPPAKTNTTIGSGREAGAAVVETVVPSRGGTRASRRTFNHSLGFLCYVYFGPDYVCDGFCLHCTTNWGSDVFVLLRPYLCFPFSIAFEASNRTTLHIAATLWPLGAPLYVCAQCICVPLVEAYLSCADRYHMGCRWR